MLIFITSYMKKQAINFAIEPLREIRKNGVPWEAFYRIMYYTRLFRYIHKDQYPLIVDENGRPLDKRAYNINSLRVMKEKGFLTERSPDVFSATKECQRYIEKKYLHKILPDIPKPDATGGINALNNTAVFIQALKVTNYYDLLFPEFAYIDPDALLVQKYGEKYKLTFLEIESEKFGWNNYLENKRDNYLKLAKDIAFYDYWTTASKILGLRVPTKQELKFSVTFVCSLDRKFGNGFNFKTQL